MSLSNIIFSSNNLKAQLTDTESNELKQNLTATKIKMYKYESILKSIIEIQTLEPGKKSSTASGFIVKNDNRLFVVTNKHVIGEFLFESDFPFYDTINLIFRAKTNKIVHLPVPIVDDKKRLRENIKIHPRNFVDISIIEITELLTGSLEEYDFEAFTFEHLVPSVLFSSYGISVGCPVVISGYPLGIKMEKNYPISSTLHLTPPFKMGNDIFNFKSSLTEAERERINNMAFKAIGNAFTGMSGGPIIILSDDYPNKMGDLQYAVIGIFSFGSLVDEEKDLTFYKDITAFKIDCILQTFELFK